VVTGDQLKEVLPFMAQQRLAYFRDYPYRYEGNMEEELAYLTWFSTLKSSAAAVAFLDSKPVGFLAGTGMVEFEEHFKGSVAAFENAGLKHEEYFYVSEAIILLAHRGNKLCSCLASMLGQFAKERGYTKGCFVTESHATHPLKPKNYQEVDALCLKMGCTKTPATLTFSYKTLQAEGSPKEEEHTFTYWTKNL
jgi:hypothetical protein